MTVFISLFLSWCARSGISELQFALLKDELSLDEIELFTSYWRSVTFYSQGVFHEENLGKNWS